ncbi:MAG TPA: ATP-binding cassette domain-containing protein [Nocardioidaceae bacterium]|nr:ATP-binding cassette domain-containing protein [Nocardioidaceae bacterium]
MTHRPSGSPVAWLGALLALYLLVPIVAFVARISQSADRGFAAPGLWSAFGTSVESATISTALVAVCGIPLAHWLARSSSALASAVGTLVQLPLALPPVMSGIVLIYVVGPYTPVGELFGGRLTDSVAGIVLAQTFVASPFLVIAARSAFEGVDPALEDLAAALGHHGLSRFLRVALPVAAPGIRAGLLLTWLRALGEYGATVLLSYHPYSLPVFTYVQFSGAGVPNTQAPTAIALGLAVLAVVVNRVRRPVRRRGTTGLPGASHPRPAEPTSVACDLDLTVGDFRLRLAHRARSHRVAILGPSGSGKSLTLRALAGLLGTGPGSVEFGGAEVRAVPTEARGLGYLPQGLRLFPGRTVWQQVTFATSADPGLAAWWLRTLHIEDLVDRLPAELSGGQRQRVGLAQALSHSPQLVLLDEPFSALDAPTREELRSELRRLQRDYGLSTVLVTHDPEEAALLADEIVVLDHGRVLQAGPRAEVFHRPASPQVARLLGIPNLSPGLVVSAAEVEVGGVHVHTAAHGLPVGSEVLWCVRPERVAIVTGGRYPATLVDAVDVGTQTAVTVRLGDGPELRVRTAARVAGAAGDPCRVDIDTVDITLWAAPGLLETGR